ncbi:hypothetical protein cyc_07671, partial [Cyclospora cayetanensis]
MEDAQQLLQSLETIQIVTARSSEFAAAASADIHEAAAAATERAQHAYRHQQVKATLAAALDASEEHLDSLPNTSAAAVEIVRQNVLQQVCHSPDAERITREEAAFPEDLLSKHQI